MSPLGEAEMAAGIELSVTRFIQMKPAAKLCPWPPQHQNFSPREVEKPPMSSSRINPAPGHETTARHHLFPIAW